MIRSMYSAISGLRNHQTMMEVVGNNIANVNTAGFKSSSVVFQDVLAETLWGAGAPGELAGTNPAQLGLGSQLSAISTNFGQGALQRTNRGTDVAIEGDGFFVVREGAEVLYTRVGSFTVNPDGTLAAPGGGRVQGWQADATGTVDLNGPEGDLAIPVGWSLAPRPSTAMALGGNLPADAAVGARVSTSIDVYDAQGAAIRVNLTFTKSGAGQWTATATHGAAATAIPLTDNVLTFGPGGELTGPADRAINIAAGAIPGVPAMEVLLGDAGDTTRVTQFGNDPSLTALGQDGYGAGALDSFTMARDGRVVGVYSNGETRTIGVVATATFANPEGLERVGGSNYRATGNSGVALVGTPGTAGRGLLMPGQLEMSNVDLAQEFTSLIVAQRGFQANSRVITSSDELLADIVNLKR